LPGDFPASSLALASPIPLLVSDSSNPAHSFCVPAASRQFLISCPNPPSPVCASCETIWPYGMPAGGAAYVTCTLPIVLIPATIAVIANVANVNVSVLFISHPFMRSVIKKVFGGVIGYPLKLFTLIRNIASN
jgi:hypothetical protein